jgi:hypothetical protein
MGHPRRFVRWICQRSRSSRSQAGSRDQGLVPGRGERADGDRDQAGQRVDPPPRRARVRQRFQPLPRPGGQILAAGTGLDHATRPRATMPMRACHTSFMQTSETYMIRWRARAHQQCDLTLLRTPGQNGITPEHAGALRGPAEASPDREMNHRSGPRTRHQRQAAPAAQWPSGPAAGQHRQDRPARKLFTCVFYAVRGGQVRSLAARSRAEEAGWAGPGTDSS